MADVDKDGFLSDHELIAFQQDIFGQPLTNEELASIKACIQSDCVDGFIPGKGVTEKGFLFLNQLFIQRGRLETTWTVLKHYDFDEHLDLLVDYSILKYLNRNGYVPQLSCSAENFVSGIYDTYVKDGDSGLKESNLSRLFDLLPANPWESYSFPGNVEIDENGNVTRNGFMGQWHAFAYSDPMQCVYTLKYFGYSPISTAIDFINAGNLEQFHNRPKRKIFKCLVIGDEGCGKTSLMRSLIGRAFSESYLPTDDSSSCAISGGSYKNDEKYIKVWNIH